MGRIASAHTHTMRVPRSVRCLFVNSLIGLLMLFVCGEKNVAENVDVNRRTLTSCILWTAHAPPDQWTMHGALFHEQTSPRAI